MGAMIITGKVFFQILFVEGLSIWMFISGY